MDRQLDRWIDLQIDGQTDRQMDKQTDRWTDRCIDRQMDLWMDEQIDRTSIIIVFLSLVSRPPVEVLISSPEGGRVQGMNTNTSLSDVTPPVAINTKNRTIFYYNTNDKYVYRRSLDANLNPEVITY